MFDIGFSEIIVIAVVALLVVGPNEFPTLVRTIGAWIGKVRRFVSETKSDLDQEFRKADELKQLIKRESELASLHEKIDARTIKKVGEEMKPVGRADYQVNISDSEPDGPLAESDQNQLDSSNGSNK